MGEDKIGAGTVVQIFIAGFIFCIVLFMLFGLYHPEMLDILKIRHG